MFASGHDLNPRARTVPVAIKSRSRRLGKPSRSMNSGNKQGAMIHLSSISRLVKVGMLGRPAGPLLALLWTMVSFFKDGNLISSRDVVDGILSSARFVRALRSVVSGRRRVVLGDLSRS